MTNPHVVVCFDRDETVSTNPHPDPDKPSVPLSWVKFLAHRAAGVDVWATGNQTLRHEAAIPGTKRALDLWARLDVAADDRFSIPDPLQYELPRRDRLHVLQDLYEGQNVGLVVVDDADLRDLAVHGWTHYFPWEFVKAVEAGSAPVTVPDDPQFSDEPFRGERIRTAPHFDPHRM